LYYKKLPFFREIIIKKFSKIWKKTKTSDEFMHNRHWRRKNTLQQKTEDFNEDNFRMTISVKLFLSAK